MSDQFLTRAEAQSILRVSKSKMFRLIYKEGLPAIKIGSTYRIRRSDLDRFLDINTDYEGAKKDDF